MDTYGYISQVLTYKGVCPYCSQVFRSAFLDEVALDLQYHLAGYHS